MQKNMLANTNYIKKFANNFQKQNKVNVFCPVDWVGDSFNPQGQRQNLLDSTVSP